MAKKMDQYTQAESGEIRKGKKSKTTQQEILHSKVGQR
jgi:hypothetical protein